MAITTRPTTLNLELGEEPEGPAAVAGVGTGSLALSTFAMAVPTPSSGCLVDVQDGRRVACCRQCHEHSGEAKMCVMPEEESACLGVLYLKIFKLS